MPKGALTKVRPYVVQLLITEASSIALWTFPYNSFHWLEIGLAAPFSLLILPAVVFFVGPQDMRWSDPRDVLVFLGLILVDLCFFWFMASLIRKDRKYLAMATLFAVNVVCFAFAMLAAGI